MVVSLLKNMPGIESKEGQENGWLVHTQATPFGWTTPGWNYYWGWSPAANAWMMQNVYDYYKFTKDETYLKEKIYPMLKETAKFWNSFLHYDNLVTVGFLLHHTHQSMELSRLGIPLTNL